MYCITSHRWMHGCAISVVSWGTVRVHGIVVWHAAMWIPVKPVSPTPEYTILVDILVDMIIVSAWFALVAGVRGGAMCVLRVNPDGGRYRCTQCHDYDMCQSCVLQQEGRLVADNHVSTLPSSTNNSGPVVPSAPMEDPPPSAMRLNQSSFSFSSSPSHCVACHHAKSTHVCVPCGHVCLCENCSPRFPLGSPCPVCAQPIEINVRM